METISAAEVVEALSRDLPSIVATDADGTLWTGDVGDDWLDAVAAGEPRINAAHLRELAEREGLGHLPDPAAVVRSARRAYEDQSLDEPSFFRFVALTLGNVDERVIRLAIREALVASNLVTRLVPETLAVLDGARASRHRIVVVSASPRLVVEEALSLAGVAFDHVIGIELSADATHTSLPLPYAHGKTELLDAFRGSHPVHAALGDSPFDAPMLALARTPLAVRPKPALVQIASGFPRLRRLVP